MEWVMTFLATLLIVFFIVLIVGGLSYALGARGPWPDMIWFFAILFFATLAIGAWARPVGPAVWDVPWLTFLFVAIFVALLIAAATPDYGYRDRRTSDVPLVHDVHVAPRANTPRVVRPEDEAETIPETTAIGIALWIFLVVAASILILGLLLVPATPPGI